MSSSRKIAILTSDFQGHMRVVGDELEDLFVDRIFHRETVHSDYLISDLKRENVNYGWGK